MAPSAPPPRKRAARALTRAERQVRLWVKHNYGQFTQVANEFGLTPQFVARIAYNQAARSEGLRVEKKLLSLGCPLMQKLDPGSAGSR